MAAAIVLAKAGYRVSIHEQRSAVGGRFHDDYQGLENWSRADDALTEIGDAGIEANWWHKPFHGGTLYDPSLRPINITSPEPLF